VPQDGQVLVAMVAVGFREVGIDVKEILVEQMVVLVEEIVVVLYGSIDRDTDRGRWSLGLDGGSVLSGCPASRILASHNLRWRLGN
jgi:hypothetical protein